MKKLHSTIKQLTLLICMFCTTSTFADDGGTCGENITWTYVEATKTLTISGSGKMSDFYTASSCPWNNYRESISNVVLENGVTNVGSYAFAFCTSLYSITIPNSVVNVGSNAFQGIKKVIWLTNTPPSGWNFAKGTVNYVPNNQFGTTNDIIVYPFLSSLFEVDGVKYVPVSPSERTCDVIDCVYDESKTEVNINNSVTYQGIDMKVMNVQPYTFYQNPYLQKVNLDISGHLSQYALSNCQNLQIALLGNNVTNIDDYAFSNCQKLESIIIPDAVNDIGQYAFSDCTNMASVIVGDGTETIGAHAFENCSNLTSATIGNSTRFIQQYAFSGCTLLPAISIPGSVRLIDDYTFQGCKSLKEIVVKDNNTNRRTTSFDPIVVQLGASKTITIGVAKGEELSFNYQSWQGSITISFLGKDIPHNEGSFKQIFNKDGKVSITLKTYSKPGYNSFCNITNMKLIESGSLLLGSNGNSPIFVDCPLDTVFIDRDLAYRSESNSGYSPFYNNSFLRSIEITNNGEEISDNEFFGCTNLQNVQIGDGVTTIGDKVFSGCSGLKSFSFGTNVRNIGKEAFSDCTSLTQLTSHATTPPICGEQALDDINKWTCKLTVPYGCIEIYQTADQWKEFFFIEEGEKTKEGIAINEENFPDENFRSWLLSQSYGSDGVLTEEEIAGVSKISVYGESIQSLKGIEYFTALTHLDCSLNQLTSIDVSENIALTYLNCSSNQLTSLDVSKNTALTELYCSSNQLTSLDVSGCTALTSLDCHQNQIKGDGMDALITCLPLVSNSTMYVIYNENEQNVMTPSQVAAAKAKGWIPFYNDGTNWNEYAAGIVLINNENFPDDNFRNWLFSQSYGSDGVLTEEEIAGVSKISVNGKSIQSLKGIEYFTALTHLDCSLNKLTSIDVSENIALTYLNCSSNQLTSLDISKNTALISLNCCRNQITSLDVSKYTALTYLNCEENRITSLNVSKNTALTELYCYSNQLTSLDVSKNSALTGLTCASNQLTSLDVSKNTALTELYCSSNRLTSLDMSKNTSLTYLSCHNNQLTSLDVSKNTALTELWCAENHLTSLDVSKNTALTRLDCYYNQLTSLDVSGCTALTRLDCYLNQLTSLDVSGCTALTKLDCSFNQLTSLDVSKNTALTGLYCYNNKLASLDVSGCTALTKLYCYNNELASLDVSGCTALTELHCYNNELASLDVSGCTALTKLDCSSNLLTSLDVSKNTALTELYCYQNRIKGDGMDALITCLPLVSNSTMHVIYNENEQNVMTPTQVAAAKAKGWIPLYLDRSYRWHEYAGSDPSGIQGIMLDKKVNAPIYDLNGRRLTEPQKGINIIGGKKVLNH